MGMTTRALRPWWPQTQVPRAPASTLAPFGALYAALAAGLVGGAEPATVLAVAIFATFVLLALVVPVASVYLLVATAWVPLEDLFGSRRDLLSGVGGGLNVSGVRLAGALTAFVLALLVLRRDVRVLHTLSRPLIAALAVYAAALAWLAMTAAWSPERVEGLRAVAKLTVPLLAGWVLLADAARRDSATALRRLLVCLVGTVLAGTVYGAVGVFDRRLLPAEPSSVTAWYGWAGWSLFGFILAIAAVCAFAAAQHGLAREARAVTLLALVQIPLCLKRITVAAAFAGLLYLASLPGRRRWVPAAFAVAAVLALALYPPLTERMWSSGATARAFVANPSLDAIRLEGRDQLWRSAVAATHGSQLVIGHGAGAFTSLGPTDRDRSLAAGQLHSEPVRIFYDGGAIGLLLLFGAVAGIGFALVRMGTRTTDRYARGATYGASAAVLVYLVTSLTDNTFDYYTVGAYLAAAVAAALVVVQLRKEAPPT